MRNKGYLRQRRPYVRIDDVGVVPDRGVHLGMTSNDGASWQTEQVASTTHARMDISVDPDGGLGVLYGQRSGGVGLGSKP